MCTCPERSRKVFGFHGRCVVRDSRGGGSDEWMVRLSLELHQNRVLAGSSLLSRASI